MMNKLLISDTIPPTGVPLDEVDRKILATLSENGRSSIDKLARLVGLSRTSAAERVRRLEASGVIQGFFIEIDPRAFGYSLQAIVKIKPLPGKSQLVEETIKLIPECVECDKVIGDQHLICRIFLKTIGDLDNILSDISKLAMTHVSIVRSTFVERRSPPMK